MNRFSFRKEKEQRGVVLLEFAIVAPVFVILVFSAFDLAFALRRMQIAATLSREVASLAYRDCLADVAGDPANKPLAENVDPANKGRYLLQMQECLDRAVGLGRNVGGTTFNVSSGLQQLADSLAKGTHLKVSVYRVDGTRNATDGNITNPTAYDSFISQASGSSYKSAFCIGIGGDGAKCEPAAVAPNVLFTNRKGDVKTFNQRAFMVVGEAFVPHSSFVVNLFNLGGNIGNAFYDFTIL